MGRDWKRALMLAAFMMVAGAAAAQTPAASQADETPAPDSSNGPDSSLTADLSGIGLAQNEPNPLPEHTGWGTLVKDTGRDFAYFPRRKSTWVLLAGGAVAALAVHPADDYVQSHIVGNDAAEKFFKPGKIIGGAAFQTGAAIGLWAVGRYLLPHEGESRTNKVSHLGFDLLRAQIVSQALVHGMKLAGQRDRPDGECCAFPSGHAASAFAVASVIERHFGYRASWPALLAATYVGASRLVENRHWLSDVVFGAALGEAVGWTVVGRHGRSGYALQPVPVRGGLMVAFVRTGDSSSRD